MYNKDEKAIIWLSVFEFLTLKKLHNLIELYDTPSMLLDNFSIDKDKIVQIVGIENYDKMSFALDDGFLDTYINNYEKMKIKLVTYVSDTYPQLLKETVSPPVLLYCKGNVALLNSFCLAIVGTRRITKYGKEVTYNFASSIASANITIVSGLADGVDSCAHSATLEVHGKTIAVLGSGLNEIYPATNKPLAEKIIENDGLIISEYKPNAPATTYNFPARNRIIAGLSHGVIITEATLKSGSMHTKEYAIENNRDIFAVPGRITDIYSKGCNEIIKNCQSAMVLDPQDVLSQYGKNANMFDSACEQVSMEEQMLLDIISTDEVGYEELASKCGIEKRKLNTLLVRLELKGIIKKLPGNVYSR